MHISAGYALMILTMLILPPLFAAANPFAGITDQKVLPLLRRFTRIHGGMNVPAADGRLLHDLIVRKGYKRGLELGTSNGYSALWLGLAFKKTGGRLITIEIEPARAREARRNFRHAGLAGVIDSRINNAFHEIPRIEGTFDFIFMDVWKRDYIKFYRLLIGRLRPGGAFTAHNVVSQGYAMRDFLRAIRGNPRLKTAIHRTSHAGVSISIRRR